jgi:hypothetical protein
MSAVLRRPVELALRQRTFAVAIGMRAGHNLEMPFRSASRTPQHRVRERRQPAIDALLAKAAYSANDNDRDLPARLPWTLPKMLGYAALVTVSLALLALEFIALRR